MPRGGRRRPSDFGASIGTKSRCCSGRRRCRKATRPSSCNHSSTAAARSIFFPPRNPERRRVLSASAGQHGIRAADEISVENWRGDQDLARPHAERRRPAGRATCRSAGTAASPGEFTPLATLARRGARSSPGSRPTTAASTSARPRRRPAIRRWRPTASSLYVAVQRALAAGAAVLGNAAAARSPASRRPRQTDPWKRSPGPTRRSRPTIPSHAGVYSVGRATAGRESLRCRGPSRRCWPTRRVPSSSGARFRPRRRPGRQQRLADPGNLAAVPGRHDGGHGCRGRLFACPSCGAVPAAGVKAGAAS